MNIEDLNTIVEQLRVIREAWKKINSHVCVDIPSPQIVIYDHPQFQALAEVAGKTPKYLPTVNPSVLSEIFIHNGVAFICPVHRAIRSDNK